MNSKYKNKISNAVKNRTLGFTLWNALHNRWTIWHVKDSNIQTFQLEDVAFRKIEKKYSKFVDGFSYKEPEEKHITKIVWQCWFQGVDNAPQMVRSCMDSIKEYFYDYKINILTEDNISDFVELPEFIIKKYKCGIITPQQYSDILRAALLDKYGGVWIDATVYCTGSEIKKYIDREPLLVYKNYMHGDSHNIALSSWFIASRAKDPIIHLTYELLKMYWEQSNTLIHYYLFHFFFTMAARKYKSEWQSIPRFNNTNPHMLVAELNDTFNEDRYEYLSKVSSLHKLNWKLKFSDNPNTFYNKIILAEKEKNSIKLEHE